MKTLTIVFLSALFIFFSYSQDKKENPFKYPLERELDSKAPTYPGPVNTNPAPPVFFNINISQNSAPQNEPSVCISRKNPNRVVAAWRDFRYGIDPNANRRVGYSYSTNAGLTWSGSLILDSLLLPGLTRNSDPVVTVDTAGNFYIAVIAISPTGSNLTLAVYKSVNGGMTFPFAYISSQTGTEDKEWIASDLSPISPFVNNLYISWTSFSLGGIRLTKSTNGGANWLTPVAVSATTGDVQGSHLCVSRNGQINVVWLQFSTNGVVRFDRSTDGGTTFGTDVSVASGTFPSGLPNDVNTFPNIAVDNSSGPRSGWLYIAFADNRNGDCDVFLCKSTDNGSTWSPPFRVNNDPINNGKIQYWPAIEVSTNGNLAIIYMDTRNTANNTIIEAYIARSYDGGSSFTNELISTEPSPTGIPGSNVRFGDYIDIDYVGTNVVPVWTDERNGGFNMDIFTAEISEFIAVGTEHNTIPKNYTLLQNYPNPFNPSTFISFGLPTNSYITLKVYDIMGREVKEIVKGNLTLGYHTYSFNASGLTSGIYFYTLTAGDYKDTRKMVLIK